MQLSLIISNLYLTKFLLSNTKRIMLYNVYFQFHYLIYFVILLMYNSKTILIFSIIFSLGEVFVLINYILNKKRIEKYLLYQNFILVLSRLSLVVSLIFFEKNPLYLLITLFIMIIININAPILRINSFTKRLNIDNWLVIIIVFFLSYFVLPYLSSEIALYACIGYLLTIFSNLYTFRFNELIGKYKIDELKEDKTEFLGKIRNKNILDNNFKNVKLIVGYQFKIFLAHLIFFLLVLINLGFFAYSMYLDANRIIPESIFFRNFFISLFMFILLFISFGVYIRKKQKFFYIITDEQEEFFIRDNLLHEIDIKLIKRNKCYLGLDLYLLEDKGLSFKILINPCTQ